MLKIYEIALNEGQNEINTHTKWDIYIYTPFTGGIYLHLPRTRGNFTYIFTYTPRVRGKIHIYLHIYAPSSGLYPTV